MKKFAIILKNYIEMSLAEITEASDDFNNGQRYAYVEMIEMLQSRLSASEQAEIGLDYDVESVYPLEK